MASNKKQNGLNGLFEEPADQQQGNFEQSLDRLSKIVETLERDATSLADAMKLYEEGVVLAQACRKELQGAELKITELRARAEGGFEEEEIDL